MKLLIVDDNYEMRSIMKAILKNSNDDILECDNGLDAYDIYKDQKPDCVLMDIEMKPVDGIKATQWIKLDFPQAKIVVVTQYDTETFRIHALNAGADDFLSKENLTGLRKVIEDVTRV